MTQYIRCDGPGCERAALEPGAAFQLKLAASDPAREARHFCSWRCLAAYGSALVTGSPAPSGSRTVREDRP